MKNKILNILNAISAAEKKTGMEGKLFISVEGTVNEYEEALKSITNYRRLEHSFCITEKLTVIIYLA